MRHFVTDHQERLAVAVDRNQRIGAGGQGQVYLAELNGERVAVKLLSQVDPRRLRGLRDLEERCGSVATLPRRLLFAADRPGADPVGYVMRFIDPGRSLAASRLFNFEEIRRLEHYSWHDAVRLALRLAESVAALHRCGVVVGDLNCENVLFQEEAADWRAVLLDTDSFQITDADGCRHHCPVSRPPTTAPELIGADLARTWRTRSSDDFALAVLIHQLLLHDHPYDNAINRREPDLPVTQRIARGLYPHAAVPIEGLSASPLRPAPHQVSPAIARAFRRSFHPSRLNPFPGLRPTAAEWVGLLHELHGKVVPCRRCAEHHHNRDLPCLWCAVDEAAGQAISRFPVTRSGRASTAPSPRSSPVRGLPEGGDTLVAELAAQVRRWIHLQTLRASLIDRLLDSAALIAQLEGQHGSRSALLDSAALERLIQTRNGWRRLLPGHAHRQAKRRQQLDQLLQKADAIVSGLSQALARDQVKRKALLDRLAALDSTAGESFPVVVTPGVSAEETLRSWLLNQAQHRREKWLVEQLEKIPLRSCRLEGFGEGRLALLEDYGLVNAGQLRLHLDQITALPGIGVGLQRRLEQRLEVMIAELERMADQRRWRIDPQKMTALGSTTQLSERENDLHALQQQVASLERSLEDLQRGLRPQIEELQKQEQSYQSLFSLSDGP
jgi:DNA-binding helix-hairpin-helix protein with protein kinase domain